MQNIATLVLRASGVSEASCPLAARALLALENLGTCLIGLTLAHERAVIHHTGATLTLENISVHHTRATLALENTGVHCSGTIWAFENSRLWLTRDIFTLAQNGIRRTGVILALENTWYFLHRGHLGDVSAAQSVVSAAISYCFCCTERRSRCCSE